MHLCVQTRMQVCENVKFGDMHAFKGGFLAFMHIQDELLPKFFEDLSVPF